MDRISNKSQKLIFNLIYFSFVFSLLHLFGLGIGLKLNIFMQILMVFLGSMVIKFFLFNPLILYVLLATSFLGGILVNHYITPFLFNFIERAYLLLQNIINNLQGKENIAAENILIFWGILIVLVSFYTSFILFKGKSIYLLLPVYFGFFLFYWYNFFDQAYWMISIFLIALFILVGINKYFIEKVQIERTTSYDFEKLYTPWLRTVIVYSILIVSIALLLPKNYNYIQWPWLQQKVYTAFPFVEKLRSYNSFSREAGEAGLFNFSITGYQEESFRLGGPVSLSDEKIMTVRGNSSNYLRGNVRQIYTGNAWETISEPSKNYGLRQDFSELSKEEKELYYEKVDITITNHNFASTTLFSPFKPESIRFIDSSWVKVNRDDSLIFSHGIYSGESYHVQAQKPLPYGILVSLGINNRKQDIDDSDIYLQIPRNKITERTKKMVKEIVKDKKSDFEKAVAIENYLRSNYKYNLNVNEVPESSEFIDYFLFEGQEGYCTYFASAMAIMLRLEGIPSRYIEGFLVKDSIETGIYEVKHKNAHTWVEAFIEPVGWMTFEPTPAFSIEPRLEDYQQIKSNEGSQSNISSGSSRNHREDMDGQAIIDDHDIMSDGWRSNIWEPYEDISSDLSRNTLLIIIGIVLLIIPVMFSIGLFQYKYKDAKAKKLSNDKRIIYLYKQILRLMELTGYPQKCGETHYEYANRVAYKFHSYEEIGIKEITEIFVRSKYSKSTTSNEDVLKLEIHRETLENRVKNHLGKITYYYRKYVKKDLM